MAGSTSWRASLVGAVGLLLLSACGETDVGPAAAAVNASAPVESAQPSPLLDSPSVAEREAVAAYAGMVRAWVDAAVVPDPDAAALRQFASGEALKKLIKDLIIAREIGKVGRGQPISQPVAIDAAPTDAPKVVTVSDCLDDSNWLEYKTTGELWDDLPGGRHDVKAVVKQSDAGWRVDSFTIRKAGTC